MGLLVAEEDFRKPALAVAAAGKYPSGATWKFDLISLFTSKHLLLIYVYGF